MIKKIIKTFINEKWLHLIIGGIIINALCFLMYFVSSAESSPNSLPYIVTNENTTDWQDFMDCFLYNNSWNWAYNQIQSNNFFGYDFYEGGQHKYAFYFPSEDFEYNITLSNNDYDTFNMTTNSMEMSFTNFTYIKGRVEYYAPRNVWYFYGQYNQEKQTYTENVRFFVGSNKGDGNLLVPNLAGQNYLYEDNEYQVVFGFGNPTPPVIPNGHATPPEEFNNPLSTSDHDLPREVPNYPTINNYSWTTHNNPPIDTTNLESLIESLIDIVIYNFNYLFSNLAGLFNNLLSNLKSFFEYIGSVIEYYGGLIISNIQNAITTFYNNMVSLGESISQTVTAIHDLLTNPLDTALLNTQLNNSSFVGAIRTTESQITSFFGIFSDISQPDNIIFEIDLRDLWFNGGIAYLDFSIISPILPFIRLVLGCILLYSLIVTIVTNINSYIGGNGAKNDSEG